jgi:oligoendopeptidase F
MEQLKTANPNKYTELQNKIQKQQEMAKYDNMLNGEENTITPIEEIQNKFLEMMNTIST